MATICRPNSFLAFYPLQHHEHIRYRRIYDEQKAVVVMQISLSGLPIKRETCQYAKVSQRLK